MVKYLVLSVRYEAKFSIRIYVLVNIKIRKAKESKV